MRSPAINSEILCMLAGAAVLVVLAFIVFITQEARLGHIKKQSQLPFLERTKLRFKRERTTYGVLILFYSLTSLGITFLTLGSGSIFWTFVLFATGILTLSNKDSAFLFVSGILLIWSGIVGILVTFFFGIGSGIFLICMGAYAIRRHFYYQEHRNELSSIFQADPASQPGFLSVKPHDTFPSIALAFGVIGFIVILFGSLLIFMGGLGQSFSPLFLRIGAVMVNIAMSLAVPGFALGLASILTKYTNRDYAFLATGASALTLISLFGLLAYGVVSLFG